MVPAELRARLGLAEGVPLVMINAPGGVVLLTREQLKDRVRSDLAGVDLVGELLAERRRDAASDDAA